MLDKQGRLGLSLEEQNKEKDAGLNGRGIGI